MGILKSKLLRNLFMLSVLLAASLPLFTVYVTYPAFIDLLTQSKEAEAERVAGHMSYYLTLDPQAQDPSFEVVQAHLDEWNQLQKDFTIHKYRLFSSAGQIIAGSQAEELGQINTKPYFHKIVSQGRIFTKTVTKNHRSMEGEIIPLDVVETYVPLMRKGVFFGAFEIYFDITRERDTLEQMLFRSLAILFGVALVLFLLVILALHRAGKVSLKKEEADRRIRTNEARLRAILGTALDAVISIDEKGRIMEFNPAAEKLFGYSAEEVIGQEMAAFLIPPEVREQHRQGLDNYLKSGQGRILNSLIEVQALRADGSRIETELAITVVPVAEGQFFFTAYLRDITERKRMLESLREALSSAQEASQAKSAFLAIMSHEIRTPMNAILGMAELLAESNLTPEQQRHVRIFNRAGESLLTLINDILDLSKIEAGQLEIESVAFDLPQLVRDIVDIFREVASLKGITIDHEIVDPLMHKVIGDETRLRQILFNLMGNAVKFTDEGQVVLKVQPTHRAGEKERLRFSVIDSGIGIPKEKQSTIFAPFTQVDSSTSRRHGGTGLGLAICNNLVEMMGGHLQVKSQPSQGSTFHFTVRLPRVVTAEEGVLADADILNRVSPLSVSGIPQSQQPALDLEPIRPMSILLVDDSEDNRVLIQAFLKKEPHRIDMAENGQEALEKLQANTYDLTFMDMQMPVMDGYTATRNYRRWEREKGLKSIPIIALTAFAMKEDTDRILAAGCDLHLTKPIRKVQLLSVIRNYQ
ncbi:MAG: PAS domain S-box protein [Magnetococcales bacterium]|nr:PAS domain S-box protein [Magnetococcales bacterium]